MEVEGEREREAGEGEDRLHALDDEALLNVLAKLSQPLDLAAAMAVCRRFFVLGVEGQLWRSLCMKLSPSDALNKVIDFQPSLSLSLSSHPPLPPTYPTTRTRFKCCRITPLQNSVLFHNMDNASSVGSSSGSGPCSSSFSSSSSSRSSQDLLFEKSRMESQAFAALAWQLVTPLRGTERTLLQKCVPSTTSALAGKMADGEDPPRGEGLPCGAPLEALLPGLPDDVALHVVACVPRGELPLARHVSRAWRVAVRSVRLYEVRRERGLAEPWLYALTEEPRGTPFHMYDPQRDTWHAGPPMGGEGAGEGFACAAANGKLFVLGGTWNGEITADVRFFDPITNKWGVAAPMTSARAFFGCSVIADRVYVTGGQGRTAFLSAAEVYCPEEDRWEPISNMEIARADHLSVVLNGKLWAIGGECDNQFTLSGTVVKRSVELFSVETGTWNLIENMWPDGNKTPCPVTVVGDELYVARRWESIYIYNPKTDQWRSCGKMPGGGILEGGRPVVRSRFGFTSIGERIFLFGGIREQGEGSGQSLNRKQLLNTLETFHVAVKDGTEDGGRSSAHGERRSSRFSRQDLTWKPLARMGSNKGPVLGHAVLAL